MMIDDKQIVQIILKHRSDVLAIYVYGSFAGDKSNIRPDSDLDLALLLPFTKQRENLLFTPLHDELVRYSGREVDLINLRQANTIMQKEVIAAEKCIYYADRKMVLQFEALVLSYYQELNARRADIIEHGIKDGRFYNI